MIRLKNYGRFSCGRLMIAIGILLLVEPSTSTATEYSCKSVQDSAVLSISGRSVNVHDKDRKCKFTVDNAADSDSRARMTDALNFILSPNEMFNQSSSVVAMLSLLAIPTRGELSSSQVRGIEELARSNASELSGCLYGFKVGKLESFSFDRPNIKCIVLDGRRPEARQIFSVEVRPTERLLIVAMELQGERYVSFFPHSLFALGITGFRFRN
jgi:hypothetical protein